jgi:DNA-binding CsgD family transcriptional regulator
LLIDRADERRTLNGILAEVRQGSTVARVVVGDAGIGKTALLDWAVTEAADMLTVRITGIEQESALAFGGLYPVVRALEDSMVDLPSPQRGALRVVLGREAGRPPGRFLVNLAVLTLITTAAATSPILLVIDDVQWIDRETQDVLAFVARRALADSVGLLFGMRGDPIGTVFEGIASLEVGGLDDEASYLLLASRLESRGLEYDSSVANRILAECRGNPLAIVQLGDLLASGAMDNVAAFEPLPMTQKLERHYLERIKELSAPAQRFLLLAACEPTGNATVICDAAKTFGICADAAEECVSSSLLVLLPTIRFRHPLIRSAVHTAASPTERRRAHVALASASEGRDEDMRAWHLGAGTLEPEEEIASLLEASAERARSRGGQSGVASFLLRASDLTPDPQARGMRLMAASGAAYAAGSMPAARAWIEQARVLVADSAFEPYAQWMSGLFHIGHDSHREGSRELLAAARAMLDQGSELTNPVVLDALVTGLIAGELRNQGFVDLASATLARTADPRQPVGTLDLLLKALATRLVEGFDAAVPIVIDALSSWNPPHGAAESTPYWIFLGGAFGLDVLDLDGLDRFTSRVETHLRERPNVPSLDALLNVRTVAHLWCGRLGEADACRSEFDVLCSLAGRPSSHGVFMSTQIDALRGNERRAREGAAEMLRLWASTGFMGGKWVHDQALVYVALGRGDYQEAFNVSAGVLGGVGFGSEAPLYATVVEAGVRTDHLDAARAAADVLDHRSEAAQTPWALGLAARCRALLGDGSDAEHHYEKSIRLLEATGAQLDFLHSVLLYGEWLRRCGRSQDARAWLRGAHSGFDEMGAVSLAERARVELAAAGERIGRTRPVGGAALTEQETQVAELAMQLATKAEIAERLYLSVHTVDYHLRNVYRKLGVRSRSEFARAYRQRRPDTE